MSVGVLFWLAILGLMLVTFMATGVRVFHEFSHYDLEQYCKRRNQASRFDQIVAWHEKLSLAAESLQSLGATLLVLAASVASFQLARVDGRVDIGQFFAALSVGALLLLTTTSWIPWAVVRLWSSEFLYHTWRVWYVCGKIAWPLTIGVSVVLAFFQRLSGKKDVEEDPEEAWEDEIRTLMMSGQRIGSVEEDMREMIEGVIELDKTKVSEVMTPRSRVDAIDIKLPINEILEFISRVGRTRLPVYEGSLENTIGVLFVKDLLSELTKSDDEKVQSIRPLLRDAWFVPSTNLVDKMLSEFLKTRSHLAIVLDEYHNVSGVVTIEDVLEEIVGEITDETDPDFVASIVSVSNNLFDVVATATIDEVNESIGVALPDPDEVTTIAGLVLHELGEIPKTGREFTIENVRFKIIDATRRGIHRLQLERLESSSPGKGAKAS